MVLDLNEFDIILEMDWLSKHHACINYLHKIVTFKPKEDTKCIFQGEWIVALPSFVSCVKAKKMIKKICVACLATVNVEEAKEEKSASKVPMVKEYLDVFLDD